MKSNGLHIRMPEGTCISRCGRCICAMSALSSSNSMSFFSPASLPTATG
jgi:hypothetical protein